MGRWVSSRELGPAPFPAANGGPSSSSAPFRVSNTRVSLTGDGSSGSSGSSGASFPKLNSEPRTAYGGGARGGRGVCVGATLFATESQSPKIVRVRLRCFGTEDSSWEGSTSWCGDTWVIRKVGHRTREEVCQDMEEKGREMGTGREMPTSTEGSGDEIETFARRRRPAHTHLRLCVPRRAS